MSALRSTPFLEQLEASIARAARRERLSARFLTACLLATIALVIAWAMSGSNDDSVVFVYDFTSNGIARHLPWAVALCYGVLGAAALLHFAVFRRQAQQLRRQKCLALLVELEDAVRRRALKTP